MSSTNLNPTVIGLLVGLAASAGSAVAQYSPKYEVATIAQSPPITLSGHMNNHGQMVYDLRQDGYHEYAIDIMLYDRGRYTRLTDDDVYDGNPWINDRGVIVWSRRVNGQNAPKQIVRLENGELTQISSGSIGADSPVINSHGHIVWDCYAGTYQSQIYYYDGQQIRQITSDEFSNQGPMINDDDWIVWTKYDFYQNPWQSRIMLYRDGVTTTISPAGCFEPQIPWINNSGAVVWDYYDPVVPQDGILIWQNDALRTLTAWGHGPIINDRGDVAFSRLYPGGSIAAPELWLYHGGVFSQLSWHKHNQGWDTMGIGPWSLTNSGQIMVFEGRPWAYESAIEIWAPRLTHTRPRPHVAEPAGPVTPDAVGPINP
jgi:hypothetical protein